MTPSSNRGRHITGLFLLGMMLITASCSVTHQLTVDSNYPNSISLERGAEVYIAMPQNGIYEGKVHENSGLQTQTHLRTALLSHVAKVNVGMQFVNADAALTAAKAEGARYLFYPVITLWEDRATAWSGIPDKVGVKVMIYDTTSGQPIYGVELRSKSRAMTMANTDPSNLLPELFKKLSDKLY